MLPNSILKNTVTEMSNTISRMLGRHIKWKCAKCSIVVLHVYDTGQICYSVSSMPPVFLLGNFS